MQEARNTKSVKNNMNLILIPVLSYPVHCPTNTKQPVKD
ncbi:hypothetical protein FIC_00418 [Flavobacteriaceae bacterium 3519-10]|nr:hypothetical protein FIC_00418 [Flavobacteriaceae bacterium 3519-10]